jgi:peptide-methionine (S)-S-oxide reductase
VSGYIGGIVENPTYAAICKGDGHAEAIRITFDSSIISFGTLLELFFATRPTTNRQGNDVGTQYPLCFTIVRFKSLSQAYIEF